MFTVNTLSRTITSASNSYSTYANRLDHFFVSDNERHCLFEVHIQSRTMDLAIGCCDNEGQDDGPVATATLPCPSGITSRGSTIYVAEHPREYQGAIRIIYSLQSLANFQKMWRDISYSMGHILKRIVTNDPDFA